MTDAQIHGHLAERRKLFFNFRWLLFVWLGAVAAWRSLEGLPLEPALFAVLGAMLATQAGLRLMPAAKFEGMAVFNAVFLLDLLFTLLGVWSADQLNADLVTALFLGTFIAAVGARTGVAALGALILGAVYVMLRTRTAEGFDFSQPEQLLALPFLFITSLHSGLLAGEATRDSLALKMLSQDSHALAMQLKGTFADVARYSRQISQLLDSLPFGVIMLGNEGQIRFFNEMSEFAFGVRREYVARQILSDCLELAPLNALLVGGRVETPTGFQILDIHNSSDALSMSVSTYPVMNGEGEQEGSLVMLFPLSYFEALCRYTGSMGEGVAA